MVKRRVNSRAQLTIFIIFGILIIFGIVAFFLILPNPEISPSSSKNPTSEIKSCISEVLSGVLPEFFEHGFYFNPREILYLNYSDESEKTSSIAYHCYTDQKRTICSRNDAQSKSRIESEIKNKISSEVERCFLDFKKENSALDVEVGQGDLSVEVLPNTINVRPKRVVKISIRDGEPKLYENFDVSFNSYLWDYLRISNDILNQEVSCDCLRESCTADVVGLMRENKDYKITFFIGSRGEKVYTLGDYYSENKFNFAVKNCDKTP
jgi:hypothetical protein